ncbi:DCC1-like thiol-disulfide oxidoreductase family protein [Halorussus halophilus]|uniref:DCC1-like thiol-disulfide oxidoreductase family protein n=1 Tax=Halorussus halophilus TaxID=2650975 RepID=UPI0013013E00|nr:DCC1-like thiol-disulfide oxidoreductase family protein [Halorussus halophilus]
MSDYHAVLVYDGECPFCSAAASALRRLKGIGAIAWEDESAQNFLRAQFGETPFAMVFVDRDEQQVWVGREAARELCERAGMPTLVQDVVGDNYESLADAIRTVAGLDDNPDPYHGTIPLAERAESEFEELAANAWNTTEALQ